MCSFEENVRKPDFLAKNGKKWPKLAIFGQNLENKDFFKNPLGTFFRLIKMLLGAKNHQNLMRRFLNMECDERTDERTNERESIGLSG